MGPARKDAEVPQGTVQSDSMPIRALASVAPQGVQLVRDHAMLANSVWCGLVFSLALVVTVLNLLPPVPVGYRVSAQVLASASRLQALKHQLTSQRVASTVDAAPGTQLLGIEILDAQSHAASPQRESTKEPLALVEVRSLWPARTTSAQVREWLSELTTPDARSLGATGTETVQHPAEESGGEPAGETAGARAGRFARWEVATREHYLKHFRHSRFSSDEKTNHPAGTLTGSNDKLPTRFASLNVTVGSHADAPPVDAGADGADSEATLIRELAMASERAASIGGASLGERSAATQLPTTASPSAGVLLLSGSPRVRAYPGRVPTALVMSVLVLAVAGGAIGSWAHHRAQSGGTFAASDVARGMNAQGLPVLGHIRLHGAVGAEVDSRIHRRISNARRWIVQQSVTASELVVLFWCLAIAIHMVLDPLWRAMLWDNPLAALGRLLVGLP